MFPFFIKRMSNADAKRAGRIAFRRHARVLKELILNKKERKEFCKKYEIEDD